MYGQAEVGIDTCGEEQREAVQAVYRELNGQGFSRGLFRVTETRVPVVGFKPVAGSASARTSPGKNCAWDISFQAKQKNVH